MKVKLTGKKEATLLSTGRELFWKYGFKKVTVEEICRSSGVSKMTFYRYFKDKAALAKAVFDLEADKGMERFSGIMNAELPATEKMKHILLIKSEAVNNISREFLQDFYADNENGLKEHIAQKTATSWDLILADFKKAQQRGDFRKDMKPEILLYISQKITDYINDPYLVNLCGNPGEVMMELVRFFTYGISPCPSGEQKK